MAKVVLTTKRKPTYDDLPEERYHFPATYLNAARQAVGDFVLYYEPRRISGDPNSRGGRQSYFAVAKLDSIIPDSKKTDHYYGIVSNYLEFDNLVSFKEGSLYFESALKKEDGSTNKGAFGRAVRILKENEFNAIMKAGFMAVQRQQKDDTHLKPHIAPGFTENQQELERPIIERILKRPFREAAFSKNVKISYNQTCAITGLKIINGGGRAEVQAAHIKPVADNGPDTVRNGLALSGTMHWMFDRGLISIDNDYSILEAKGHVPEQLRAMFPRDHRLSLPDSSDVYPHPKYLEYHRENIFKG